MSYIWVDGIPLAQITSTGDTDSPVFIHTDHLATPRLATNTGGLPAWSWDSDGFGAVPANSDPLNTGTTTTVNLRFPGQYYDLETGLHYNWNRYYDSRTGRYITSDPIGLAGGANTYGYVDGNPLRYIDRLSLQGGVLTAPPQVYDSAKAAAKARAVAKSAARLCASGNATGCVAAAGALGYAGGSALYPYVDETAVAVVGAIVEMCTGDSEEEKRRKNCQALKDSILNTCYGLPPRKRMACYEAANTAYRQCMGWE